MKTALAACLLAALAIGCHRAEAKPTTPQPAASGKPPAAQAGAPSATTAKSAAPTKTDPAGSAGKPAAPAAAVKPAPAPAPAPKADATPAPAPAAAAKPHAPTPAEIAAVKGQKLQAVVHTPHGDIHLRLLPDVAPIAVANFVQLADAKFYDGTAFHRVEPGFVIQGGDPQSRADADHAKGPPGTGGPGYAIKGEPGEKHSAGTLAMADSGPNTAGSQFYVTLNATPSLDNRYTAFGHVLGDADLQVAKQVRIGDRMTVEIVRGK